MRLLKKQTWLTVLAFLVYAVSASWAQDTNLVETEEMTNSVDESAMDTAEPTESAEPSEDETATPPEEPEISFYVSGDVDADMASGLGGSYEGIGHALDANFTFGTAFGDKVAGELYVTMTSGDAADLPAFGPVGGKWDPVMAFDGVSIMISDLFDVMSLTVMDYCYDTGSSSYYLFKNQDMIIPLYYPRGLQASFNIKGKASFEAGFGVDDGDADSVFLTHAKLGINKSSGDPLLNILFGLGKEYGAENLAFSAAGIDLMINDYVRIFGGALFPVTSSMDIAVHGGLEGAAGGDFSVAYAIMGGTDTPERTKLGETFTETFMVYVEPGYAFSDYFAAGLPLEFHMYGKEINGAESSQFWVVPTFYFYPMDGMEIWAWGQTVFAGGEDPGFYAGLEVMFGF